MCKLAQRLIFALAILTLAGSLGLTVFLSVKLAEGKPIDMLTGPAYDYPQRVVDRTVAQGGTLVVERSQKCNLTDQPIRVRSVASWRVNDGVTITVAGWQSTSGVRPAGSCWPHEIVGKTWANPLPEGVTPGLDWRLVGQETPEFLDGTKGKTRDWRTELFRVTE